MIRSIKDKRLRHEVPLLPYETQWLYGDDHLYIPKFNIKISVTSWYPFRPPTMMIDGIDETEYVRHNKKKLDIKRITESWCPSYGIREFVDNFLQAYDTPLCGQNNTNDMQPTDPPAFSNSLTSTSTNGL